MGHRTHLAIQRGLLETGGPKCKERVIRGPRDWGHGSWARPLVRAVSGALWVAAKTSQVHVAGHR